jgi:DHA2 family multidrug resistance protein
MSESAPQAKPAANPWLVAMVVSLAAFMEVLDTTITNVSLSHIAGSLAASQDESTWVLTSYLVANGIILPLSGWLSGVFGRKNFFMLCIGGFTAASFACGIANSLPMLIIFRLIQGLAGGGLQPTQQAIILDSFPLEKRGSVFAITGITMIVAPILGPTLGGYITDNFSWRWIFYMNVPVGTLAFFLVGRLVEDPPHAKAKGLGKIDYTGLGLIALALGALQVVLDKGQENDWFGSDFILSFSLVSGVALISALIWMLPQEDPVIDFKILGKRSFGLACVMIFFLGFALYGSSALMPLLVQSQYGYDATLSGLVLSPGGIAVIVFMPVVGKLVSRVQPRYLISFGMLLTSIGMWMTMLVTPQASYSTFVIMRIMQVVGLPFLFIPISTLAFVDIPREKSSKASALYALMRNLGGSIGIAILASYVTRHTQIHQSYLSSNLSPANRVYEGEHAALLRHLTAEGMAPLRAGAAVMAQFYRQLGTQASILSYADAYRILAYITLFLSGIALCMPKVSLKKKSDPAASPGH